jgi:hypothetical protein
MPRERDVVDPYAPPPPRKDKSGRFVRYALIAAMLGAGAYGYAQFSQNADQTAALTPPADEQLADAGVTTPEAMPQAAPQPPQAAPARAPQTSPPARRAPVTPPVQAPATPDVAPEPVAPTPSTAG